MPDYPPLTPDDAMPFGKHKGEELWHVIETDVQYVEWLIEEADVDVQLDDEAWEMYQEELSRE